MAKSTNKPSDTTTEEVKENNDLAAFLGADAVTTEQEANEFAIRSDKIQVVTLKELLVAEAFSHCLSPITPMIEPQAYEHHKKLIDQVVGIAMEVALQVGKVYDDKFGQR